MMSSDFHAIVQAIAGPLTQRTLDNLKRWGEDMWLKSTGQDATPEDQAAFTPELIAQAHEAARQDNARIIVSWALAIHTQADHAYLKVSAIEKLQRFLDTAKEKLAFCERDPEATPQGIQRIKENILDLETRLRDLQKSSPPVPGYPSSQGPVGEMAAGYSHLDGHLSDMPPTDP